MKKQFNIVIERVNSGAQVPKFLVLPNFLIVI